MEDLKKVENLLKSQKAEQILDSIKSLIELKNYTVKIMLSALIETKDNKIRKEIILSIVDNFKDERIIPTLKELIIDKKLEKENAILVYALGEYSNSMELLDFLVELVLNQDYHTALNAINIIFSMIPQFNEELVTNLLNKVEFVKVIKDDKMELIQDLKLFLKNQIVPR
jgi:hypothetical protein